MAQENLTGYSMQTHMGHNLAFTEAFQHLPLIKQVFK